MDEFEDKIFNNDSVYMKSLVGKQVEIETQDNVVHSGTVYVIDPIYKTTVLHTNQCSKGNHKTVFILYHAIKALKVLSHLIDDSYVTITAETLSPSDRGTKKQILQKWLRQMHIEVSECGEYLKIDDHLVIVPPYGPENCICNNTLILDRIQKIITSMPADFK